MTFRKVVTPWLPLRRPGLRVAPGADQALLLACLSTLLPVDSSSGWHRSSALDWLGGRSNRHQRAAGKWPWRLNCGAGGASRISSRCGGAGGCTNQRTTPPTGRPRPCWQRAGWAGPPKSVSMACWRGLTALALVGGNGSPPCPKSLTQQLISLIPAI